jgi:hypothetical protein
MLAHAITLALVGWGIGLNGSGKYEPTSIDQPDDRITIAVVLADALENQDARTKVIRRKAQPLQNVIVVTRSTTPPDLQRAVIAVAVSHKRHGRDLPNNLVSYVGPGRPLARGAAASGDSNAARTFREVDNILRRLRAAEAITVPGYGNAPGVIYETRISYWVR